MQAVFSSISAPIHLNKAKAGKGEILLTNDNKDYGDEIEAAVFHVSTERAANAAVRGYIGGEFLKRKRQEEGENMFKSRKFALRELRFAS